MPAARPNPRHGGLWRGLRIGLLGGSFNPAHDGHRHISLEALKRLDLHQVWWLVSPQNPLKARRGMAPLAERVAAAAAVARHPRIVVTDLEAACGTRFTADTLGVLRHRFSQTRFVWMMGADNLAQVDRWDRWTQIFHTMPVAVFDRPSYSLAALRSPAARRFGGNRLLTPRSRRLSEEIAPAWAFFEIRRHPLSATALRQQGFGTDAATDGIGDESQQVDG